MIEAKLLASKLQAQWVPRQDLSIEQLRLRYGATVILLNTKQGLRLYSSSDSKQPLFFHPSMAALRIQSLVKGDGDALLEATQVAEGDKVLDCTAGLASDAIVFSHLVGATGRIIALESEKPLHLLIQRGLATYKSESPELNTAMRRIELLQEEHKEYLERLPDRSVDIVYFDPMFRQPLEDSVAINPLRGIANAAALEGETIRQAIRVARKRVVLKEHRSSDQFERLGFTRLPRAHSKIAYGVIET